MLKKAFAVLIASFAAPFWGGACSLVANTHADFSLEGIFEYVLVIITGILPAAVAAQLQAPPYAAVIFLLPGLPLLMNLGKNERLTTGSVFVIGVLIGLLFAFFYEYFPVEAIEFMPYIPREHLLLTNFWAMITGITGTFLLWYAGFDGREG